MKGFMLEPVKVPQNVYIEDRIIGPVTLRHIVIIAIGAGISYAIWAMITQSGNAPSIPVTALAWSPTAIAAAFAFVKINDISLTKMILLAIEGSNKPKDRAWAPHAGISINFVTKSSKTITDDNTPKIVRGTSKLLELNEELERERHTINEQDHSAVEAQNEQRIKVSSIPVEPTRIVANNGGAPSTLDGIRSPDSPLPH